MTSEDWRVQRESVFCGRGGLPQKAPRAAGGRDGGLYRFVLLMAWIPVLGHASEPRHLDSRIERRDPEAAKEWMRGKSRAEVVALLGEPDKITRRRGATTLVYKFKRGGSTSFVSAQPNPYAFPREHEIEGGTGNTAVDVILTALDLFMPDDFREYEDPQDHAYRTSLGPLRRLEVQLNAQGLVEGITVKWRKRTAVAREARQQP